MSLADRMKDDGAVFVNPADFGEAIVYTPWPAVHGTATAALDGGGGVATVTVATPGSGYQEPPPILLTGGGAPTKAAKAVATINPATGAIASITVTDKGEGYTSPPAVVVGGCYAVVRRELPGRFGGPQAGLVVKTPMLKATVRNSATDGVVRVNTGKDKITTTRRVGGAAEEFTVAGVISQTTAIWKLRLK